MSTAKLHPIKKARLAAGMTQAEVALAVGVTKASVSRWETWTDQPAPSKAKALVLVLTGLTLDHIYAEPGRVAA